jgi:hypothetical protein
MKKTISLGFAILLILLLASCSQWSFSPDDAAERDPAGEAGEEYAKIVNLVVEGSFSGDDSGVVEYLDHGAYGEELGELLNENGLDPDAPQAKFFWIQRLRDFNDADVYVHGDVLLSRNVCSLTSNLLVWLLHAKYTHCGVLNTSMLSEGYDRDTGCVLTATLNTEVSGVTYETWRDWSAATTVTLMREDDPAFNSGSLNFDGLTTDYPEEKTEYSFIAWDPQFGLVPVPAAPVPDSWPPDTHRDKWDGLFGGLGAAYNCDPLHWYCSKTTWWLYKAAGLDIENNELIDDFGPWGIRTSGLYQLYRLLFGVGDGVATAFCYFANDMCVWPDEIYTCDKLELVKSWGLSIR